MARVHPSLLADDPTAWSLVAARGDIPSYSVYNKSIRNADLDDRDYRVVTLSNGIQALLVHDAKTDKAAASLDVSVGHLSDPVRRSINEIYYMTRLTVLTLRLG